MLVNICLKDMYTPHRILTNYVPRLCLRSKCATLVLWHTIQNCFAWKKWKNEKSSNLTKVVYRDGVKITGNKIGITLFMRHSRMMGDCCLQRHRLPVTQVLYGRHTTTLELCRDTGILNSGVSLWCNTLQGVCDSISSITNIGPTTHVECFKNFLAVQCCL